MGMLAQVQAQMELVQGAPAEALLRMVQRVERIPFSICFNSGLRRRRRQTFVRTRIEEDAVYIRVKTTDA